MRTLNRITLSVEASLPFFKSPHISERLILTEPTARLSTRAKTSRPKRSSVTRVNLPIGVFVFSFITPIFYPIKNAAVKTAASVFMQPNSPALRTFKRETTSSRSSGSRIMGNGAPSQGKAPMTDFHPAPFLRAYGGGSAREFHPVVYYPAEAFKTVPAAAGT